jgi:hypothetical protein
MSENKEKVGLTPEPPNELSVLFPNETVQIGPDRNARVEPISIEDIPKVLNAFATIMIKTQQEGLHPIQLVLDCTAEIMKLLPYSVQDVEMKDIPSTVLPDVLEAVIKVNFSDAVVGKWKGLFQKAEGIGGVAAFLEKAKEQAKKMTDEAPLEN